MKSYSLQLQHFYVALVLILSFVAYVALMPLSLFAQTPSQYEIINDDGQTVAPQLFVDNIFVPNQTYGPGDTVRGSFMLYNNGLSTAGDVTYRVDITTLTTIEGFTYPEQPVEYGEVQGPIIVPSGSQEIDFAVSLPALIPDAQIGLMIEAFVGEEFAAQEHIAINTDGATDFIDVRALVYVNNIEDFEVLAGPTIEKDESIDIRTVLSSPVAYTNVVPVVRLYAGPNANSKPISEDVLSSITIPADTEVRQTYPLPATIDPGVYTVVVHYEKDGQVISSPVEARYIIAGLKPKINIVSFNDLNQTTIDSFDVMVEYVDIPFNIRVGADGNYVDPRFQELLLQDEEADDAIAGYPLPDNVAVRVKITDAGTNMLIAEEEVSSNVVNPITITFSPIAGSEFIVVTAELLQDGDVIDTEENFLTIVPIEKKSLFDSLFASKELMLAALLLIIILLITAIILVSIMRHHAEKNTTTKKVSKSTNKKPIKITDYIERV